MKYLAFMALILFTACTQPPNTFVDKTGRDELSEPTPEIISRIEGELFLSSNYCACQNGEVINVNYTCVSTCSAQATTDSQIQVHLQVTLGATLAASQHSNLKKWCTEPLVDPETQELIEDGDNVGCELILVNKDTGAELSPIAINSTAINDNKVSGIILGSTVSFDDTYNMYINETLSGIRTALPVDFKIFRDPTSILINSPIQIEPITQYACIDKIIESDPNNNDTYSLAASKIHFYYDDENRPDPSISTNGPNIDCHGVTNPQNNTPLIDQTPGQISLWHKRDPRFATDTTNGGLLIDEIVRNLSIEYGQEYINPIFSRFEYITDPISGQQANSQVLMGYMIKPFLQSGTFRALCPGNTEYQSGIGIYRAMKEILNVETQPIYLAQQVDAEQDNIFVTYSDIADKRFYIENGVEIAPTESNISGKKIQFYWPLSDIDPLIRKPHQTIYTIQAPEATNPADLPHDNRIGCVPKI